jgi:asparaginyl-tRNA synthetase
MLAPFGGTGRGLPARRGAENEELAMTETAVREIYRDPQGHVGRTATVSGWIRTARFSKNVGFLELNDGTFMKNLQVVISPELENYEEVSRLGISSSIVVEGELVESPKPGQPVELKATRVEIEGTSDPDFPLQKKRHTFEYLRTIAHLRPRGNTFTAVFRVRSLISYALHTFFQERGFVYVHTPILTASDAEGAGSMFRVTTMDLDKLAHGADGKVDYSANLLGRDAFLTVSGQLEVETHCMAFRNVYTFGPTFRAENSNTARHACEFWMIEPEISFAGLPEVMDLAEDMVKYLIAFLRERAPEEMEFFNRRIDNGLLARLDHIASHSFERIPYDEAISILEKSGESFEHPVAWENGLQTEHERYLCEKVYRKPVFVTDYPKEVKAFYMRLNDDGRTVAATDLLVPKVGEIIGGSQREERMDVLKRRIAEMGLDESAYWWYLDLRRYGTVKHAGYGLGLERFIMYVTGMENIRDVISFPRTPNSIEF